MSKRNISQLAIFGGEKEFDEPLFVGRPNIGDREKFLNRVNSILDNRWFTNYGPFVRQFEEELAKEADVKHAIAMSNGTVALEIAIRALGMTDEVIVPSMTFIATAHALQWQRITPVFADVDPVSLTLDPEMVEKMITPRTTGIIGVHLWSRPCDIEALQNIADRYNLKLLFDAAHALGCSYNGKKIGGFGDAEVFSFHATKFVNSFEGGAVLTDNDELADKIRLMKNFGFADYDKVIYTGTNGKMNEISAAMGITSLESMDHFIEINQRNYNAYQQYLDGIPGIELLPYTGDEESNYQYCVITVDEEESGLSRDQLIELLHAEDVIARRYFYPGCHNMEPYKSYFPNAGLMLPVTEDILDRVICLPTGTAMNREMVRRTAALIRFMIKRSKSIRKQLEARPTTELKVHGVDLELEKGSGRRHPARQQTISHSIR